MQFEKQHCIIQGMDEIQLPQMVKVRQKFNAKTITDPAKHLRQQMQAKLTEPEIKALQGKRIGISAGSRGIPHYKELIKAMADQLKEWGAEPFVFPAMGSHAGATAEGQAAYLRQFGITEAYIGVPVLSTMEVVQVATLADGFPVYCDKYAVAADGIVVFNKIKPHTHFKDRHESGLLKMICIGIGKHRGAATFHQYGFDHFCYNLERVAAAFLEHVNVVFSVGLVQNAFDDIGWLEVIRTEEFFNRDAALLKIAKKELAQLWFKNIDVLVIDEVGKEISGVGFDPNVTGRTEVLSQQAAFRAIAPDIKKIVLLDITEASHGLGIGMGEADIISYRFANKLDFGQTYTNVITNNYLKAAAMPLYMNSDEDSIKLAVLTSMVKQKDQVKIVHIKNTITLDEIEVSTGMLPEVQDTNKFEILSEPYSWAFNEAGNLW